MNDPNVNTDYRYERKFLISALNAVDVESIVRMHPSLFYEIYNQRYVNNIYFETNDFQFFFDNINGLSDREKIRVRWYGDMFGEIAAPKLELKTKKGFVMMKTSYRIRPFILDVGIDLETIHEAIETSGVPEHVRNKLKSLRPVTANSYLRKYFMSANGRFRITLDSELWYYRLESFRNQFLQKEMDRQHVILELKYNEELDDNANIISNFFPFRVTKNSKYVQAVELMYAY